MDERILFHLSKSENRLKIYMKNQFKDNNIKISPAQMGIMFLLKINNSQSMSELSSVLDIDNSAITRLVDRLEKMEYVKRELNPDDRRQFLIRATDSGIDEINRAKVVVKETNDKIKEGFTREELEIFMRVVSGIYDKF